MTKLPGSVKFFRTIEASSPRYLVVSIARFMLNNVVQGANWLRSMDGNGLLSHTAF